MTLKQIQTYVIGVLSGWFENKTVLDKFSETPDGRLMYNGILLTPNDTQVDESIQDTLEQLTKDTIAPLIVNVDVNKLSGTVQINGLEITCSKDTEIASVVVTMNEPIFLAENADPNVHQVVKDAEGTVILPPLVSDIYGPMDIKDNIITIVPIQNNHIAGWVGTVDFTIPSGVITDAAGNSRPYSVTLKINE
jgi:hypothetical protein